MNVATVPLAQKLSKKTYVIKENALKMLFHFTPISALFYFIYISYQISTYFYLVLVLDEQLFPRNEWHLSIAK